MSNYKPIKTHAQFLLDLDRVHPNREWEVLGEYVHNMTPILIRDKYGDCVIKPNALLQRSQPSVKTAINKTLYTINKFKDVWGETYDYSQFIYEGARAKSTIICREHGIFYQDANTHLSGRCGCSPCANKATSVRLKSNTKDFIEKAIVKYGAEKYSFKNTIYETATSNITITCPIHGDFEQTPNRFLNGQTCTQCSYKENPSNYHILKKKRNNSVFYIIECFNHEERFIKLGVTSKNVKARFSDKYDMPYEYNVLREFRYPNMDAPDSIETELLKFTKSVMYHSKLKFSGRTELRQLIIKDSLLEFFDVLANQLYYMAFFNFAKAYSGIFNKSVLNSGNYSKLEVETVMKGYEIHKAFELK